MSDFVNIEHAQQKDVESMQHNLRTPLNTILGYTQILLKNTENLTSEQRQQIEVMHSSGEILLRRINDILEIGKIRECIIDRIGVDLLADDEPSAGQLRIPEQRPPKLEELKYLIRCGDITGVLDWLSELENKDKSFRDVTGHLRGLAERYQTRRLEEFVASLWP